MTNRKRIWGFGIFTLAIALGASAGCSSTLGIDEARLDPTFSESGKVVNSDSHTSGECKPFDNSRIKRLAADGTLSPLPNQ